LHISSHFVIFASSLFNREVDFALAKKGRDQDVYLIFTPGLNLLPAISYIVHAPFLLAFYPPPVQRRSAHHPPLSSKRGSPSSPSNQAATHHEERLVSDSRKVVIDPGREVRKN